MPSFTDQLGRTVHLVSTPQRIISVVPSQTELLFDLGLGERVIGITKFCIHPNEWFRSKTRVGGTKNLNLEKIKALQPDLIIANKEENTRDQIEALAKHYPLWISDINKLEQAIEMIIELGKITDRKERATQLAAGILNGFSEWSTRRPKKTLSAAYLIWKNPWITVGGDCFIQDMLNKAGYLNVFEELKRYPSITLDDLVDRAPELVLLSSEPYPFKEKDLSELQIALPHSKIVLVDGELFSWYGSRLAQSPAYFERLHEQIKPLNSYLET